MLVVDDDAATRRLIADVLQPELGLTVRGARDGHEAIAAMDAALPDLLLLDLKLPGLDGFGVLRWLKANYPAAAVPVLAITAAGTEATLQALDHGCDGFVRKPFDIDDLIAAVRLQLEASRADPPAAPPGRSAAACGSVDDASR